MNIRGYLNTICVAISAKNLEESLEKAHEAKIKGANLIELRLDHYDKFEIEELKVLKDFNEIPIILTLRKKDEGGLCSLSEHERIEFLKRIIEFKPGYIDIELSTEKISELIKIAKKHDVKTIISYHNFSETPNLEELKNILHKIESYEGDITKIITTANNLLDNLTILKLINLARKKIVNFAIGKDSIFSILFSIAFGAYFSFASLDKLTAPGQVNVVDMKKILKIFSEIKNKF